jgi:nucleoside-diphosphate-sugar epimerase
MMNILLLGGAGYVGAVIARRLAAAGHDVRIADQFLFLEPAAFERFACTRVVDMRALTLDDFNDVDVVLNLAALSNDPAGELDPRATAMINVGARVRAAALARAAGVPRYFLFSSCSVYGANENVADETSPLNPLTAYAIANVHAERGTLDLNDDRFCVTVVRLATVFGVSPAMRFDLAINTMTLHAFANGHLTINGDGQQYRPFVHVEDVASAIETMLAVPARALSGDVFNLVNFNLKIRELGERIRGQFDDMVALEFVTNNPDIRNYRVSGTRAADLLGFVPGIGLEEGVRAIKAALQSGLVRPNQASVRLNGYRKLVEDMQLDSIDRHAKPAAGLWAAAS